jgi:type IV pilus assembly protein PilW
MRPERTNAERAGERGFTITEVMVAITLSVFLLLGLFSILQQTRKTNTTTSALSQLQDDERVAMTIISDTIQQAGYVPEANGAGANNFSADSGGGFATQGQIISASAYTPSGASSAVGERLTMRYVLGVNDTTILCDGESVSPTADKVYKEIFELDPDPNNPGHYALTCVPHDGATGVPLVSNVANLTFQWAVNSTSAGSTTSPDSLGPNTEASNATNYGCPADAWQTTAQMQPPDWTNVCAVKVDIVFINPLYKPANQANSTAGQTNSQYITFERVISIQSRSGVNITSSTQT